ncbi:FeS-binding protein [Methylacidimicrobium sp. AP8]|uniref:NIL domain-containing protein n=1 Tax=Methylacidimicrobium sp. AP8 TaxID=2730359 RepID=UPI0018C023A5|nr:NIL domain-containing protein [Methylacidimicrobium sp. AP8]CAB4243769.1 FeS-binding protein [Methylacidimicrobium sp. AP8]
MAKEKQRLWLTFDEALCQRPIIWELGRSFELVFNIRSAQVTQTTGIVAIELEGEREVLKRAIQWLENLGVIVEPVELSTIEG